MLQGRVNVQISHDVHQRPSIHVYRYLILSPAGCLICNVYICLNSFTNFSPPRFKQEVIDREQLVNVQGWSLSFIFSGIHLSALHIGTSTAVQWNVLGIYPQAYRLFFFICQFELDAKSLKVQLTRIFMHICYICLMYFFRDVERSLLL